jgi:hypothetical protein
VTTELVLLLSIFAFIVVGAFFGDNGPIQVFVKSGPRLGARIEKHVTVGREFKQKGQTNQWSKPDNGAPDGSL